MPHDPGPTPVPAERAEAIARAVAERLGREPGVRAVALGGSRASGGGEALADALSDLDLYVYADPRPSVAARRALVSEHAVPGTGEIDNRYFEPGDEWLDRAGIGLDVMYRDPAWIEDRIAAAMERAEPSLGWSTCLVYNVARARPLVDPGGWFAGLRARARAPYPEALARAICAHNAPMLRGARCSFLEQLTLAGARADAVASNHRAAAFLASWFDMLFAANHALHPGEKRLVAQVRAMGLEGPDGWEAALGGFLAASPEDRPGLAHGLADGIEALVEARLPGALAARRPR
ncbi:nucleotidyltransferase domain-containing protein [Salinarimonas rosea]|uniref:nucleotidyltransferase domain-containing protein n=1 Tax=Salinarimonas rosea TaxID=552063 RepID=UPI00041D660E|nr:nucleotidyltransferase domain-containing protein [Salinarimonas rosea]